MKKFIYLAIILILLSATSIHYHEQVHKVIFLDDGCQDVKVVNHVVSGYTECLDDNYKETEQSVALHNMNEIKGYNDIILVMLLFMIFSVLVIKHDY